MVWYQVVVCVFWCWLVEDWGFDVEEVVVVQVVVNVVGDVCVQFQFGGYFWMMQVDEVVVQVGFFVYIGVFI